MNVCFAILLWGLLLFSSPADAQWVKSNPVPGDRIVTLAQNGTSLFCGFEGGVCRSSDQGLTWTPVDSGLTDRWVFALVAKGMNLFAGTNSGVFLSTDNGATWTPRDSGLHNYYHPTGLAACSFAVQGASLFTGTVHGVFVSTDDGTSWTETSTDFAETQIQALIVKGSYIFAGTRAIGMLSQNVGLWLSTDGGVHWAWPLPNIHDMDALAFCDTSIIAGSSYGVYRSTDNGLTWMKVNSDIWILSLAVNGTNIFAGTFETGVFLSTNDGTSWISVNSGLTNFSVYSLLVSGEYLFAGSDSTIYRRPISEMVSSVVPLASGLPERTMLDQNYPNPFNPSTTIRYVLPQRSRVVLTMYSTQGQVVASLVNGEQQAGYHLVRFDGTALPSGVYFYRFQAGSFVQTKKALLIH